MNKSNVILVIIIIIVVFVGFVVIKNRSKNIYPTPTPYTNQMVTTTPVQDIDQQALDKELDQIDQIAKGIQDSNDTDLNDLNNLNK